MDAYRTEEEQVEAIKRWWQEYGNSVVIGVGVALLALAGYKFYTNSTVESKSKASVAFQSVLEAQHAASQEGAGAEEKATLMHVSEELIKDNEGSTYAQLTAFIIAKEAVASGDFDKAAKQLQWIVDNAVNPGVKDIALLRLARVKIEQDKADEALALLAGIKEASYKSATEELRGDIYKTKGDEEKARKAYQSAVTAAEASDDQNVSPLLQMKLDNVITVE